MIKRLERHSGQLLALGILGAVVFLGFLLVVRPILEQHRVYDEVIAERLFQLQRYRALSANQHEAERQLMALEQQSPAAEFYLSGSTLALASANMQQHLRQVVEAEGAQLVSTQGLAGNQQEVFPRVGLQVQIRASIESLLRIIYALETRKPKLFFENTTITAHAAAIQSNNRIANADWLDVRFDLIGYSRTDIAESVDTSVASRSPIGVENDPSR